MTSRVFVWRIFLGAALLGTGALGVRTAFPPRAIPPTPLPVSWLPHPAAPGSAILIEVGPDSAVPSDSILSLQGAIGGEPLRFERRRDGRFVALGAVPVNAGASMLVPLRMARSLGDTIHQMTRLPLAARAFPAERLRLPPRFVTPPDSLQEQLEEERRTVRDALARTAATPRLWERQFATPLAGRITDAFGTRREVNRQVESRHLGLDIAGRSGTPVAASNRGIVVVSGRFYYQGNAVYLDHGAGLVTSYLHLSRILVSAGDTVDAGQVVGRVGATGRVTGPHLHWTAYFGWIVFDPSSLVVLPVRDLAGR